MTRRFLIFVLCTLAANAQDQNKQDQGKQAIIDSFELIWSTLRDQYWDPTMAGLNWQELHDTYLPKIKAARSVAEARPLMEELIHKLPSSHLAVLPSELYGDGSSVSSGVAFKKPHGGPGSLGISVALIDSKIVVESVEAGSPAAEFHVHPGWIIESVDGDSVQTALKLYANSDPALVPHMIESFLSGPLESAPNLVFIKGDGSRITLSIPHRTPSGKLVQFGNLPPLRVVAEHRQLAAGAGYIRLNIFLDPVSVMPEIQQAISDLRACPGIILDLRGNPGGLANMGTGIAGWFVSEEGLSLGTMLRRDSKVYFRINPRLESYTGKLAILVNGGSASTSEFLAQGLKDLGRARVFGTRTAGAALPSVIIQLPDGDRFQYPEASYTSTKGIVVEGSGVEPDQVVAPTIAALLAGHDLALESAISWISVK